MNKYSFQKKLAKRRGEELPGQGRISGLQDARIALFSGTVTDLVVNIHTLTFSSDTPQLETTIAQQQRASARSTSFSGSDVVASIHRVAEAMGRQPRTELS